MEQYKEGDIRSFVTVVLKKKKILFNFFKN